MPTCSTKARMVSWSRKAPPPVLMTNTLPLYMWMYGAAPRSARTVTACSPLCPIIVLSPQQSVEHGHLHDHAVGGFTDHARARPVQDFVGDRDVAAHRQAMHEMAVGPGVLEPAFPHAPVA